MFLITELESSSPNTCSYHVSLEILPRLTEELLVSHQRVSGFADKEAGLWGGPGNFGEVQGTSGEVWQTFGEPLDLS